MSDSPPKPRRRRRWWTFAAGGVIAGATAVTVVGPAAHLVVDSLADGARIWRLGRIKIDDVSGAWLGDLRAGSVTIADDEGVWIEARDVTLSWSPQALLFGGVRLNAASAASITISRQPVLLEARPSSGADFDVRIRQVRVDRLLIAEPVVGEAGEFAADFALELDDAKLGAIDLTLQRLDSDADRIQAVYRDGAEYALRLDLVSAPGGVIARALGVGEQGLQARALGEGDVTAGSSTFEAVVGDSSVLAGETEWTASDWSAEGRARLDALPALQGLSERIGPTLAFSFTGQQQARSFSAYAETPFLAVDVDGSLDEDGALDGPAHVVATTARLSDVARESPFELGAARLEGEVRQARGTTALRATLDAQQVEAFGRRTRLSGSVETSLSDARFALEADLRAPQQTAALFANARLRTAMSFDRQRGRYELGRAELVSDALTANGRGWVNGGDGEFAGEWRIRRLETLSTNVRGEARGRWRAFAENAGRPRIWTISVDGQGSRFSGAPEAIPQLFGASPSLDARLRYENGGLTVSHARINGAQLRAGATGRIVRGQANLALEASARGPISIGGAEIAGAVDATGQLSGRIARPTLSMRGDLSSLAAGGVVVEQPVISFTLAPSGDVYAGRTEISGTASGQTLQAASNVSIGDSAISLSDIDGQWGGLQAQGDAQFNARGVSAALDVNGVIDGLAPGITGRLTGDLDLSPERLVLAAEIADAHAGELRVRAATIHAEGPLDAIAATFDMRGRLRQAPLTFAGAALINAPAQSLHADGRGTLADAPIFTRAPITADWSSGRTEATINVAVGDGVVRARWQERGRAVNGAAEIDDAPLGPLAAIWGERATGRIDGRIALASSSRGLGGDIDIRLDDARVSGRQRDTLDLRIVGDLTPERLTATLDATSESGLVAHLEANAPVETSAAPIRIALARERRGRATWSVRGPAEALWAAARLPDQSLEGDLDGEGTLEFGAGYLSGAGDIEIVDGRFEDKLTGVTLIDLDARLALNQNGVTIENFTAEGPHGGRLTATGGSVSDRQGSITVNVRDMRVADRPDARAVASGELTLAWEGLHSSLTGDLNITEANIDIAANPQAGIPTLDVIEINRPGEEDEPLEEAPAPRRNGSTTLNVNINAPGRVFTRGRGVDAEWSLDMRLAGTARNPQVFGVARAVRGTLSLSGQPFEIEDAIIEFGGDPLDARINLSAVRDTADLSARIRLIGTARDPEITFSSDPPLPEDEILPQVLFGRSVEDLSALEAAQLAASLAALSGRASLDIVDAARAAAGLDRFNIREDENGGFLVAGGVYLTRDVYVEVARTGLGEAQTRLEWTIRPRLVLITSFIGSGDQRVSLRWRRETD